MQSRSLGALFLLFSVIFVLPGRLSALSWNLMACDTAGEPRWHDFEQAVRHAKPSSTLYTPKPFPTSDAAVIADFLYRFREIHRARDLRRIVPLSIPNDERVVNDILSERVAYRVTRVENWTQMRCGWQHKQDFYYLVQVFEPGVSVEITRAVIDYSGLFVSSINVPVPGPVEPSARRLLPTPAAAVEEANKDFGIQGVDPEYVATFGSIDCDMAFPCLAFHEHGLSYVLYHRELFEVSARGPRLMRGKEVGTLQKNQETLATLTADERPYLDCRSQGECRPGPARLVKFSLSRVNRETKPTNPGRRR
jgi:hypothetical protein